MDSRISFDQLPEAVLMVHEPVSGLPQLPGTAAAGSIDRECGPNVPSYMLRPVKGHRYRGTPPKMHGNESTPEETS
eukprot:scaffold73338_cov60-Phaeocystis_antarctica.AAC.7